MVFNGKADSGGRPKIAVVRGNNESSWCKKFKNLVIKG